VTLAKHADFRITKENLSMLEAPHAPVKQKQAPGSQSYKLDKSGQ